MPGEAFYIAPFHRRDGTLRPGELVQCRDEAAAFRRGKRMMPGVAGLAWIRVKPGRGDWWSRAELLATVGDVPLEAA